MMPARVALALQADGWWLRSEIVWHKPNAMVESVRDRPTSAHEKVYLLAKSARYFYDAEAVREEDAGTDHPRNILHRPEPSGGILPPHRGIRTAEGRNGGGRNLRNLWTIATHPFSEAHFATFPPKLVEPCIKAGTSEKGCCPECGTPWVRGMEVHDPDGRLGRSWHDHDPKERLAIGGRGTPKGGKEGQSIGPPGGNRCATAEPETPPPAPCSIRSVARAPWPSWRIVSAVTQS